MQRGLLLEDPNSKGVGGAKPRSSYRRICPVNGLRIYGLAYTRPKSLPRLGPGYLYVRPCQLSTPCHYLRMFKGCRDARVSFRGSVLSRTRLFKNFFR